MSQDDDTPDADEAEGDPPLDDWTAHPEPTEGDAAPEPAEQEVLDRLTARQRAAALQLAYGGSVRKTAQAVMASSRTISRWLATHDFRLAVQQLRGQIFDAAAGRLCHIAGKASEVMAGLLDSEDENVRLRAATAVLHLAPRLRELTEIEMRLRELEAWSESRRASPDWRGR